MTTKTPKRVDTLSPTEKRALLAKLLRSQSGSKGTSAGTLPPSGTGAGAMAPVPALPRGVGVNRFPLSLAQRRLWFLHQLTPTDPVYNEFGAVRLTGPLQVDALAQTLNAIVARHESLRTTIDAVEGEPLQVIVPTLTLSLPVVDVRSAPPAAREAQMRALAREQAQQPFDLAQGPLLRPLLIRLQETEHVLCLTVHHIIWDAWSIGVFLREFAGFYNTFAAAPDTGRPGDGLADAPRLPDLPIQYADFALWQRQQLQGGEHGARLATELAYWRQQLAGEQGQPPVLALPADYPRPAVQSYRGATQTFAMADDLAAAVRELSRRQGTTLFMTLLAAFQTLLHRYTGLEDIVVGSPIAGRNRLEMEALIGFFVNTLAFRADLTGNPTFLELLEQVRQLCLGAYAHPNIPFEKLVEELQPERDRSHSPLVQVEFMLHSAPVETMELVHGLTLTRLDVDRGTAKFDLTLYIWETATGLTGSIEYNTDLFAAATIDQIWRHFTTLLQGIVTDPTQRIAELPLMSQAENTELLLTWNGHALEYPTQGAVHDLFAAQAARTPDAVAVACAGAQLTYQALNERANQLAHHLHTLGVGPETLVGVCLERSLDLMVGLLGVLTAGGAYIPLDPGYPAQRLAYMLEDAQPRVILTQAQLLEKLPPTAAQVICLERDWAQIGKQHRATPIAPLRPEHLAYVIYTSGSTGRPKGAMITHGGLTNYLNWCLHAYPVAGQGSLVHSTIAFDATITGLFAPLLAGRTVHLLPETDDLEALAATLRRTRDLSMVKITPAHLTMLCQQVPAAEAACLTRSFVIGGENLVADQIAFWQQYAPETLLFNEYGPTENVVGCVVYESSQWRGNGSVPIGRAIPNTTVYVLDRQQQPAPVGVPGELYLGGAGVARGYLQRPEITAEKFVPDPFSAVPGARLYRTGDLVRFLSDGNLEFLGRFDDQVKIRGVRIELGEVEAALAQHPAVRQTTVMVRTERADNKSLVAYCVADPTVVNSSGLRAFLKARLPEAMVPATFVLLDALPLTPNGKVDRKALPAPDTARPALADAYVAPRTPSETLLAQLWADVLNVEQVGIHDNFFELGGHSLLATKVISRMRDAFQVQLPLVALFDAPTVAELAERVATAQQATKAAQLPALQPVPHQAPLPLSFAQQRLWLLEQLEPGNAAYHLPGAVRLSGPLNLTALEQSFTEIVRRHASLRTTFVLVNGEPRQQIAAAPAISIVRTDLCHLPPAEQSAAVAQLAAAEAQRPFDLTTGPLLRLSLLQLATEEHVLLLTMHHIVSDGWSTAILVREFAACYEAFCRGATPDLPALPIQYADYAHWQRDWLQGETLAEQLAFWRRQLQGAPALLELPTDRPRPAVQRYQGAIQAFTLSKSLTTALKALSRRQEVTLFMTLLAAFQALLYRYTGQRAISVGTPIANRNRTEIEDLIGFFVNTLVMHTEVSGDLRFSTLLKRVRKVALDAYAHQDLPFEKLVQELQPPRNESYSPLFQVMLTLDETYLSDQEVHGLHLYPLPFDSGVAKFDLTLYLEDRGEHLQGRIEYNTDLFDATTIVRLQDHFQMILAGVVADAEQSIATLPLLTEEEAQQFVAWNQTARAYPLDQCLHELFEAQVERTPAATALIAGKQRLTYRELNQRANQLAHYLRKAGVGPDVRVGICMERSLEMVISIYAIIKAGGAYVPLDPTYPAERLRFMLEDAQTPILLTQQALLSHLPSHTAEVFCVDSGWAQIAQEPAVNLPLHVTPDNLAYVIFTSGSTGRPKGAINAHRGICNRLLWMQEEYQLTSADSVLQKTPFSFDVSVWEFFWPLLNGARLVVARPEGHKDPEYLVQTIVEYGITTLHFVPSMLQIFLKADNLVTCRSLRRVICSGEALPYELQERFFARLDAELHNLYGPTEAAVDVTYWPCERNSRRRSVPIGRPVANTQMYVLDQQLQQLPIGIPGELYIGGIQVGEGYLNRPDLTQEKFIPDPFHPATSPTGRQPRLYKTGDLARYLPDGAIEYIGRIDFQVKVRGVRIELGEIEETLLRYPGIREVVVTAREDATLDKRLVAYLVYNPPSEVVAAKVERPEAQRQDAANPDLTMSAGINTEDLRNFLRQTLPEHMIPTAFVRLDAMPLSPNGKVDRKALPAPEPLERIVTYVAPQTATEQTVAAIWQQVLGVQQVGLHDNFFDLGGHSLTGMQVVAQLRDHYQVELPLRTLFSEPTVAGLAQQIEVAGATQQPLTHQLADLLQSVEALSDEEVKTLLAARAVSKGAVDGEKTHA